MNAPANQTPFEQLGGEEKLRSLIRRFYSLMHTEPQYAGIRKLHPPMLEGSTEKLTLFLSGWLGGPPLYTDKYGHPMLRARHLPFTIGESERDQWMACMQQAMVEEGVPELLRLQLAGAFFKTADWMRNQQ
jgi:hemoglobin